MKYTKQAIQKAIDGEWRPKGEMTKMSDEKGNWIGMQSNITIGYAQMFMDKGFWQALGKSLGWEDCKCEQCKDVFPEYHNGCVRCGKSIRPDNLYTYHKYRFIDHLAESKSPESFFKTLINNNG